MKRVWIIILAMGLLAGATEAGADFYQVFNLQTLGTRSIAYAIDQTGWIAGCVKDSSDVHEAVVWERPEEGVTTMHFLSTFGGAQSEARAIYYNFHTEKHRAVGWANDPQAHQRPFFWDSGMSTIQALSTQNSPGQALGAYSIKWLASPISRPMSTKFRVGGRLYQTQPFPCSTLWMGRSTPSIIPAI